MNARPHLRVIDTETGELTDDLPDCPTCADKDVVIRRLEADLNGYRLKYGNLEAQMEDRRSTEPKSKAVDEVLDYWREQTASVRYGSAMAGRLAAKTGPGSKRPERVRARLREGFTVEQLKFVVLGALADPFLQGKNDRGKRYDDVETIFRDAPQVEKLMREGWKAARADQTGRWLSAGYVATRVFAGSLERVVDRAARRQLEPRPTFDNPGAFTCRCPGPPPKHVLTITEEPRSGRVALACGGDCDHWSLADALEVSSDGNVGLWLPGYPWDEAG